MVVPVAFQQIHAMCGDCNGSSRKLMFWDAFGTNAELEEFQVADNRVVEGVAEVALRSL